MNKLLLTFIVSAAAITLCAAPMNENKKIAEVDPRSMTVE